MPLVNYSLCKHEKLNFLHREQMIISSKTYAQLLIIESLNIINHL